MPRPNRPQLPRPAANATELGRNRHREAPDFGRSQRMAAHKRHRSHMTIGRYISDSFFHFVGHRDPNDHARNYETLKLILNSKRIRRPGEASQHGISIRRDLAESLRSGKLIVPEMVCLAEIPLEHLAIHVTKYGYFGIGLEKHHCIWHGARPVSYIPMRSDDFLGAIHGKSLLKDNEATYHAFRLNFGD